MFISLEFILCLFVNTCSSLLKKCREAIAKVLAEDVGKNRICNFTGSEEYSFADVAAALTDLSGKTVKYTPIEKSTFETQMKERGTPESVV